MEQIPEDNQNPNQFQTPQKLERTSQQLTHSEEGQNNFIKDSSNQEGKIENGQEPAEEQDHKLPTHSASKDSEASDILQSADKSNAEEAEEDEKTLSQFLVECKKEDTLNKQLISNKLINSCRYNEGYIYQQVFACITCYQDQIKNLPDEKRKQVEAGLSNNGELVRFIKPHGFCLGCMLTCHEAHDVIELYSKLDFRCDCGNSSMPFSCQLDDNKDYDNPKNSYNQTYFDSYCYCKKPHSFEYIDQFMIQCFECEDWFHNQHLTPTLDKQVDEKFILICKLCMKEKFMNNILHYQNYFHQDSKDFICKSPEQAMKRQKTSDSTDQSIENSEPINCENVQACPLEQEFDLIIDDQFIKSLCQCPSCQGCYAKIKKHIQAIENMTEEDKKLQNNLEGHINDDEEEEEEKKEKPEQNEETKHDSPHKIAEHLTSDEYMVQMMSTAMKATGKISHEGQIFIAENYLKFKEYFVSFLKQFDQSSKKITTQDVAEFQRGLENLRERPNKFQ